MKKAFFIASFLIFSPGYSMPVSAEQILLVCNYVSGQNTPDNYALGCLIDYFAAESEEIPGVDWVGNQQYAWGTMSSCGGSPSTPGNDQTVTYYNDYPEEDPYNPGYIQFSLWSYLYPKKEYHDGTPGWWTISHYMDAYYQQSGVIVQYGSSSIENYTWQPSC